MFCAHYLVLIIKSYRGYTLRQFYFYISYLLEHYITLRIVKLYILINNFLNNFVCNSVLIIGRLRILPSRFYYFTVLKSPHIDKIARDAFSLKHYLAIFYLITFSSTILFFLCNWLKTIISLNYYSSRLTLLVKTSCLYIMLKKG